MFKKKSETLDFYTEMKSRALVDFLPKIRSCFDPYFCRSKMEQDEDGTVVITVTLKEKE